MTHEAESLITMLTRQQALIHRLSDLARRQGELIDSGDADALLTLLGQRQQIMDQFVASQDDLTLLADACRGETGPVPEGTCARITTLVEDISERLGEIMRLDEQDRARLESNRDRVGADLVGLSTSRAAHDAYVRARAVTNRFADRQG